MTTARDHELKSCRQSRLYRIVDVHIPDMHYHSAQCDTLLIVDDDLALLMPDRDRDGTLFSVYEIPITQGIFLEKAQSPTKQGSSLQICWKNAQGHVVLQGKKERVGSVRLQFAHHSSHDDFCEAFDAALERLAQNSWLASSQINTSLTPRPQKIVVKPIRSPDTEHEPEQDAHGRRRRDADGSTRERARLPEDTSKEISSDLLIEQVAVSADVFARVPTENQNAKRRPTKLSKKLGLGTSARDTSASPPMLLSNHDVRNRRNEASSPLKGFGKHKYSDKAATQLHKSIPANPVLSAPLQQRNDDDPASLLGTAPLATHSAHEEALKPANPSGESNMTRKSIAGAPVLASDTQSHGKAAANKTKLRAEPSLTKDKLSRSSTKRLGPSEPSEVKHNSTSQTQSAGKKRKTGTRGKEKSVSEDVDWDEGLRVDEHESKWQRTDSKRTTNPPTKKPLKDITNTTNGLSSPNLSKTGSKNKTAAKKKLPSPAASVAPARRPRRTAVTNAKSYVESSTSDDESTAEDSLEEEKKQRSRTSKPFGPTKPEYHKIPKQDPKVKSVLAKSTVILPVRTEAITTASRNEDATRPHVEVPSSDHEDTVEDTLPTKVSSHARKKPVSRNTVVSAGRQLWEDAESLEGEALEDSYPREDLEPDQSTSADRSFGTKLNDMIATTPATRAGKNEKTSSLPFGDQERFVRSVNSARSLKALPAKPTISVAIPSETEMNKKVFEVSKTVSHTESAGGAEVVQRAADTSTNDGIVFGATSKRASPQPSAGVQDDAGIHIEDAEVFMLMNVDGSELARKASYGETKAGTEQIPSLSDIEVKENTKTQPPKLARGLEKQENPGPDVHENRTTKLETNPSAEQEMASEPVAQTSTESTNLKGLDQAYLHISVADHSASQKDSASRDQPIIHDSSVELRPRHYGSTYGTSLGNSTLNDSGHARGNRGIRVKNTPAPDQTLPTATSKTTIVHFGSAGPQNQGLPSKAKVLSMLKSSRQPDVDKVPSLLPPARNHEGSQSESTPNQAKLENTTWPDEVHVDNNSEDRTADESPLKDHQPSDFEDEHFHDVMNDTASENILQNLMAPSLAAEADIKADSSGCRNDRGSPTRSTSPSAPYPQSFTFENVAIVDPGCTNQSQQAEPCGSSLEKPVCISSTYSTSEADTSDAEEYLDENRSQQATHEIETTLRSYKHNKVEIQMKETNDCDPALLTSTKAEEIQKETEDNLGGPASPDKTSAFVNRGFLQTNRVNHMNIPAVVLSNKDSKLFSLNTTARKIFSDRNTSMALHHTTSIGAPSGLKSFPSVISVEKAGPKPDFESLRIHKPDRPSVPVLPPPARLGQIFNQRARQSPTDSTALNATPKQRSAASNEVNHKMKVVRARRQQPSPDKSFGSVAREPVLTVNTPQAFIQRLHASTSPLPVTRDIHDVDRGRDSFPDDSEFGQTTLLEQPHSSQGVRLHKSMQKLASEVSSSSMSPKSEADRAVTAQSRQLYSDHVQTGSIFACTIQQKMLDVARVSTFSFTS